MIITIYIDIQYAHFKTQWGLFRIFQFFFTPTSVKMNYTANF